MLVYMLFLAAVILVGWYLMGDKITTKQRQWCLVAFGAAMVAIMTLRYSIGFDYFAYRDMFEITAQLSWKDVVLQHKKETSYFLLNKLVAELGLGYHGLLLILNLIMVGCVLWFIYKYSSIWWLSIVLYLTLQFMTHSMNLLRQSLAVSIMLLAWGSLKDGKFWKYAVITLIAATFHVTALIMLPMYFVLRAPFKMGVIGLYVAVGLVGVFAFRPVIMMVIANILPQYSLYLDHPLYSAGAGFTPVVGHLIYCVIVMCFSGDLVRRSKDNSILIYTAIFTVFASMLVTQMFVMGRFTIYFFQYAMILLPEVVMIYKKEPVENGKGGAKKKKTAKKSSSEYNGAIAAILVLALVYFAYNANMGSHKTYPYISIWEQDRAVDNNDYLYEGVRL